jgi:hypothetical protein
MFIIPNYSFFTLDIHFLFCL